MKGLPVNPFPVGLLLCLSGKELCSTDDNRDQYLESVFCKTACKLRFNSYTRQKSNKLFRFLVCIGYYNNNGLWFPLGQKQKAFTVDPVENRPTNLVSPVLLRISNNIRIILR